MIPWQPIEALTDALKDGRELLLARPNTLGIAQGGDGRALNPRFPFLWYIGSWHADRGAWQTTESEWDDYLYLDALEPSHFAELDAPLGEPKHQEAA